MLQNVGQPIVFVAHYTKAGFWYNPPAGVTVEVYRRRADTGAYEYVVAAGAAEVGAFGAYLYRLALPDVAGTYYAVFNTADLTVDKRSMIDKWYVGISTILQVASAIPDEGNNVLADETTAQTSVRFAKVAQVLGRDISGWTAAAFTIKRSPDTDEDVDALLTVRVSNPAAPATDGIVWHNGAAVDPAAPLRLAGSLAVLTVAPDASISIVVKADGMVLPPSPETAPYFAEVNVWRGADKEQFARTTLTLKQSVRRGTATP